VQAQYAKYLLSAVTPLSLSGYVIAQGLVQKGAGAVSQVASALYPASALKSTLKLRPLYYRLQIGLFGLSFLGILVFRIWGLGFLEWWLHSTELVTIVNSALSVMVWLFALLMLTPLASTLLDGKGRPELTSFFALITTVIEIILAFVLFPHYSFFAPIYASLIALAITTPALLYVTDRGVKSRV
jgi:O-antigen/teichoic acid export membrane protein